jgi:PhzF family phenazine biosynthesis protein
MLFIKQIAPVRSFILPGYNLPCMSTELHLVDAFTGAPFRGNTAAVCILDGPADPAWMQQVAGEMNQSETAFLDPGEGGWNLRWFTPEREVDLCGHATLAAAFVLWTTAREKAGSAIAFETRSGTLTGTMNGDWITLDFPAEPVTSAAAVPGLDRALGVSPLFVGRNRFDVLAELPSAADLCTLEPDMAALAAIPTRGIIITAVSDLPHFDFVSRFFAPAIGVPEDPVTGSAHCCLGPYWRKKLHRDEFVAFQASDRGGVIRVKVRDHRVIIGGKAVTVFRGELLS